MFCSICMPLQLKQRQIINYIYYWLKYHKNLVQQSHIQIQREHPFHAAGRKPEGKLELGEIPNLTHSEGQPQHLNDLIHHRTHWSSLWGFLTTSDSSQTSRCPLDVWTKGEEPPAEISAATQLISTDSIEHQQLCIKNQKKNPKACMKWHKILDRTGCGTRE